MDGRCLVTSTVFFYSNMVNKEELLKNAIFQVGDKVQIVHTGSQVSNKGRYYGQYGAKKGDIVIIEGITHEGGEASVTDPRYYGKNFNYRGKGLKLIEKYGEPEVIPIDKVIKNIEKSKILLINKVNK